MIETWLLIGVFVVALAYSMVGHGGASGYLALIAFTTIPSAVGATTALALNVLVAGITLLVFRRAKHFDGSLAWPLLLGSVPLAFLGGKLRFESATQDLVLALVLVYAAAALMLKTKTPSASGETTAPRRWVLTATGSGIGLLSGFVGVGGGIFLSPLMILRKWAQPHTVAALSAGFIFANSIAGLLARPSDVLQESLGLWPLTLGGVAGAICGSLLGANRVSSLWLRRALGVVLLLAVAKLLQKSLGL